MNDQPTETTRLTAAAAVAGIAACLLDGFAAGDLIISSVGGRTVSGLAMLAFGSLAGLTVLFAVLTFAVIRNRPPERRDDPLDTAVDTDTGAVRIVRSAADLREGFRESWSHPATRLGFWSHFTTPFAGTAFVRLWG